MKATPDIFDTRFDELSSEEQAAAEALCYNTWPGDDRDEFVGSFLHEGVTSHAARILPEAAIVASIHMLLHIIFI